MDQPVNLIPLVCPKCSTPVPAEVDEVAWVCAQCGQGLALDEENGLALLDVHYADGIPPNGRGKPFWVVDGTVEMHREVYNTIRKQNKEAQQFWSQPRSFFIPAFSCTLEALLKVGVDLLRQPPVLQPGPAAAFQPVTLHCDDVRTAAEFVVVAVEAERKDKVKEIDFTLKLTDPVLWILP